VVKFVEMDEVSRFTQLEQNKDPVVLINEFWWGWSIFKIMGGCSQINEVEGSPEDS